VKLWSVIREQGQTVKLDVTAPPRLLQGHSDRVISLDFSADGSLLASASRDGMVRLWSLKESGKDSKKTDKQSKTVVIQEPKGVLRVVFSPDSQLIATANRDRTVKLWDHQGQLMRTLIGHSDRVNAVVFSPDGLLIASASDDKTVKLWTRDGQLLKTLIGHQGWVTDLAFSSDGEYLASAGYDNLVNIWSRQGELIKSLKGVSDSVARVNFLSNNQIISTTSWNNQVQLWRLDDTLLKTLSGHSDRITSLDWYQDGETLVTASKDGSMILWDLNLENLLQNSCDWLQDYLNNNTQVRQSDRQLCKT
jgi:WD40 repeat protein